MGLSKVDPQEVYKAIKDSITQVADLRIVSHPWSPFVAQAIYSMLDEMARNSAQAVIGMLPEGVFE